MHELSIAESILDAVRKELLSRSGVKPTRVGLRIGELSAIDVESLRFCFEAVLRGTDWEGLELEAQICPQVRDCNACGRQFPVVNYNAVCPSCAGTNTRLSGGHELDFDYLEVEPDGAAAIEVQGAE